MTDNTMPPVPTFLNTADEQKAWHQGIYTGLKTQNPTKIYRNLYATEPGTTFPQWEDREGHYHDIALLSAYTLKWTAVIGVGYAKMNGWI